MLCPIMSRPIQGIGFTEIVWAEIECKKKDCAWWDDEEKCCLIRILIKEIVKTYMPR